MSCCNKQRRMIHARPLTDKGPRKERIRPGTPAIFHYIGKTALKVRGLGSGRLYRFDQAQPIKEIDPQDAPSLARLPQLRKVSR